MPQLQSVHSYEELLGVVIDILLGTERVAFPTNEYGSLTSAVAEVLARRAGAMQHASFGALAQNRLHDQDQELVRDVFWDLFRRGFITLGLNDCNPAWPFFRLSHHAPETLAQASPFRFHDWESYLRLVRARVPDLSSVAERYLHEAIETYYADCVFASCVMLGVAAEVEFLRAMEVGRANPRQTEIFARVDRERHLGQKIKKFQECLRNLPREVLDQLSEDMLASMLPIQSALRIARNDAGHALGSTPLSREQLYVYLQLFVPFAERLHQLRNALS